MNLIGQKFFKNPGKLDQRKQVHQPTGKLPTEKLTVSWVAPSTWGVIGPAVDFPKLDRSVRIHTFTAHLQSVQFSNFLEGHFIQSMCLGYKHAKGCALSVDIFFIERVLRKLYLCWQTLRGFRRNSVGSRAG